MPIGRAIAVAAAGLLPLLPAGAGGPGETWDYRVQRGDTLIGVRNRLMAPGSDWRVLQRLNHVDNPRRLMPGSSLRIPMAMLRLQPVSVEVLYTHGDVHVERAGAATQPLAGGERVSSGDLLRTGAQSSAVLRFGDGARVIVRPDSLLRVERSARLGASPAVDTRLRLDDGGADTQVPKQSARRFEIRTPVANLGVRGTEFRTRASAEQTAVEVLEGNVATSGAAAQGVGAGFGAVATAQSVTAPQPLLPAPQLTQVPSRIDRLPLHLPWVTTTDNGSYRAQVFDVQRPDQLMLDGLFTGNAARWSDDLPDGDYLLRVRAVDNHGLEGRDASAHFTLKARPEPPFITQPRAGQRTADESINFGWTIHPGAARYRLQVADSPDFAPPRIDRDDVTGNTLSLPLPVGAHHWRMASIRPDGDIGPWGDPTLVTRVALPPPPESQAPQTTAEGVLLLWRESAGARYQVQVARDASFAEVLHDEPVDAPQWLLRSPAPGRYFVRVRSIDAADGFAGPYGAPQQVEVPHSMAWLWLLLSLVPLL